MQPDELRPTLETLSHDALLAYARLLEDQIADLQFPAPPEPPDGSDPVAAMAMAVFDRLTAAEQQRQQSRRDSDRRSLWCSVYLAERTDHDSPRGAAEAADVAVRLFEARWPDDG